MPEYVVLVGEVGAPFAALIPFVADIRVHCTGYLFKGEKLQ